MGHQFLARSRLTIDQHRDIGIGETANGAEYFLHGRRFTNNFLRRRRRPRYSFGFLFPSKGNTTTGHVNQLIEIKRFWQIFKGTALIGGYGTVQIRVRGGNNHWDIWARRVDLLEQFKTIDARHANIRNNNFWQRRLQCYEQIVTILKAAHLNAFARNRLLHYPAQ